MKLIAIDPGTQQSAMVCYDTIAEVVLDKGILDNRCLEFDLSRLHSSYKFLVIEWIESYGMPVGAEVFHTCRWVGHFEVAWQLNSELVPRRQVKLHLCGSGRAKDPNIRQALIDRFGGYDVAIGNKRCRKCKGKGWFGAGRPECPKCGGSGWQLEPGPLADFHDDLWAALALAVTYGDQHR